MEYTILIDKYEGPFDLLLNLIKKNDLDIYEIKIEDITNQYLEYIKQMEELNLDISSEYLVMAAELIEIKSRSLLPVSKNNEEENPGENLIEKLIIYKNFKEIGEELKKLEEERKNYFSKEGSDLSIYKEDINFDVEVLDLDLLTNAFKDLLNRKEEEKPLPTKITTKEYSVSERSKEIREILKTKQKIKFVELFDNFNKDYIVVSFLSILDLAKKRQISINQDRNFSDIILSLTSNEKGEI